MDYLALAQRASFEAGLQGPGPTAVSSQSGMNQHFLDWTKQAWLELQMARNWSFMRKKATFLTVVGKQNYTLTDIGITDWRKWSDARKESKIGETVADETEVLWMTYADFQTLYGLGAASTTRPTAVTLLDDESIQFNAIPDKVYSVTLPYWKTPQEFTDAGDTPTGLADELHMIIAYKVLEEYALFDQSPDVMARYQSKYPPMFTRMSERYLPKTRIVPSALA
jgi:hypothetical protein